MAPSIVSAFAFGVSLGVPAAQTWLFAGLLAVSLGSLAAALMNPHLDKNSDGSRHPRLWTWVTFAAGTVAPLVLYASSLAPSVVIGDSAEFQTVGATWGIAHPTGYPVYMLLANVFSEPFANAALASNLLSAILASLACGLLALTLRRLGLGFWPSVAGALTLAVSRVFWLQSNVAEVYALHVLLFVIALLLSVVLVQGTRNEPDAGNRSSRWALVGICAVVGLGLAHHRTTMLWLPGLALAVAMVGRRWKSILSRRLAAMCLAALIVPLCAYAYIPLRWEAATGAAPNLTDIWWHVSGSGWSSSISWDLLFDGGRYGFVGGLLLQQFTWVGLALAALGIWHLATVNRRAALVVGTHFLVNTAFALAYPVPDSEVFFLPSFATVAVFIAFGMASLLQAARVVAPRISAAPVSVRGLGLALLVMPLVIATSNWQSCDRHDATGPHDWARSVVDRGIQRESVIVADVDRLGPLRYVLAVENQGLAVSVVMPDTESQAMDVVRQSLSTGHAVYLARFLPNAGKDYKLDSLGPLTRVLPARSEVAESLKLERPVENEYSGGFRLLAVSELAESNRVVQNGSDKSLAFTLRWDAQRDAPADLRARIVLRDETGRIAYATAWRRPVQDMYPSGFWRAGETVHDYRELSVPALLPPGRYVIALEVAGEDALDLGNLEIEPSFNMRIPRDVDTSLSASADCLALRGTRLQSPVLAGATTQVELLWLSKCARQEGYSLVWELVDDQEKVTATGNQPIASWGPPGQDGLKGSLYVTRVDIPVPGTARASQRLNIAVTDGRGQPEQFRGEWPWEATTKLTIGQLAVLESSLLTNFGNKAILLGHDLAADALRPGQSLTVDLTWQPIGQIDKDYTVFIHLLNEAGQVVAQIDQYPGRGSKPTSQWQPGEIVIDPYEIVLPGDLNDGYCEVELGLYLATSMERLPIIGQDMQPIADRLILGKVKIAR